MTEKKADVEVKNRRIRMTEYPTHAETIRIAALDIAVKFNSTKPGLNAQEVVYIAEKFAEYLADDPNGTEDE